MRLLAALFLGLFVTSATFANEADHVANSDTIKITLSALSADPDGSGNQIMTATLNSKAAVAVVLRGITQEGGDKFKIFKQRQVFGKVAWSAPKFLQLNPGKSLTLGAPEYKIVVPASFAANPSGRLEFDFGPKGEVYVDF